MRHLQEPAKSFPDLTATLRGFQAKARREPPPRTFTVFLLEPLPGGGHKPTFLQITAGHPGDALRRARSEHPLGHGFQIGGGSAMELPSRSRSARHEALEMAC